MSDHEHHDTAEAAHAEGRRGSHPDISDREMVRLLLDSYFFARVTRLLEMQWNMTEDLADSH